jgi:hypothetical protein
VATALAPEALIEAYRAQQAQVAGKAGTAVQAAFSAFLDPQNLDRSYPAYLAAVSKVLDSMQAESAALGGQFYLAHRKAMGVFDEVPTVVRNVAPPGALYTSLLVTGPVQVKKSLSQGASLAQALTTASVASSGAGYRHVANAGRGTIAATALGDTKAKGWARVTDGRPCAFCAMLASRGPVYKEDTALFAAAGRKYHDRCGCFAVPFYRDDDPWPGAGKDFQDLWKASDGSLGDFRKRYTEAFPKTGPDPTQVVAARLAKQARAAEDALFAALQAEADAKAAALRKKWAGKPPPKGPGPAPKPPEPGKVPPDAWQPWLAKAQARLDNSPANAGKATKKQLHTSFNWHYFESAMQGDRTALHYLKQNQYLDEALVTEAESLLRAYATVSPEAEAAYKSAVRSWKNRSTRYQRYLAEWKEANGGGTSVLGGMDDALDFDAAHLGRAWGDALPVPTGKALEALREYTGSSYRAWNDALRKAEGGTVRGQWGTLTRDADDGFTPAPEPVILRRGTNLDELVWPDGTRPGAWASLPPPDPKDLIGCVYTQHGYMSTSIGPSAAFGGNVSLVVRVPAGHPVSPAWRFSVFGTADNEMILARGTHLFVHDMRWEGRWVVEVEAVAPEIDPASLAGSVPMPRSVK